MRMILLVGAALAVSACGGGNETEANEANALVSDNMMSDPNLMMDPNMMATDPNMSANGMTMGGATGMDANTQNMMAQDMNTNSPDTNLANGL